MACNLRRLGIVVFIILGVAVVILALTWFVIAPQIIETQANEALQAVAAKTHRHVAISDIRLRGLTHVSVGKLTVSEVDVPQKHDVVVEDIDIRLSHIPVRAFSVSSVDIGSVAVHVRIDREGGQKTNFDDVIQKFRGHSDKNGENVGATVESAPSWRRYITPFPAIHVENLSVTMPVIPVHAGLEIGAISADDISIQRRQKDGFYEISADFSALLVEEGTPETYTVRCQGAVRNRDEGQITVTLPQSKAGMTPELFRTQYGNLTFKAASLTFPSTFSFLAFDVSLGSRSLIHVDEARAMLMSLPPQKVSGVYFKEVELIRPVIHDAVRKNGTEIWDWVRDIKARLEGKSAYSLGQQAQDFIEEKAAQAAEAAIEAGIKAVAEKSETVGQDIADAVIDKVKPQWNPRDYFFSQRLFIQDGTVIVDDRILGLSGLAIDKLNLEIGYRSIRKVVDYDIAFHAYNPIVSEISMAGQYRMKDEHLHGTFDIAPAHASDAFQNTQRNRFQSEISENASVWDKLLASLDLDKTRFDAGFEYDYGDEVLKLQTRLGVRDWTWNLDMLSEEPTVLNASAKFLTTYDFNKHKLEISQFEVESNGAQFQANLTIDKRDRRLKLGKSSTKGDASKRRKKPEATTSTEKSWYFTFSTDIPTQDMNAILGAVPHALRTELDGLTWQGTVGIHFDAQGFFADISGVDHHFSLVPSPDFAVLTWPIEREITRLNDGYNHIVRDPNALTEHTIAVAPSIYPIVINEVPVYEPKQTADDIRALYPNWVLFEDLNPWLIQLITTTEDGSFFFHDGFSPVSIKAALQLNLSRQNFKRGASTLSMQLIKNLFFDRDKTIARKFQEVVYTWLMESVVQIPKKRILELYFNIIEFGPEIYGIEEAAKYYFGKRSRDLSIRECAFLIAIIPSPRKGEMYRSQPVLNRSLQRVIDYDIEAMFARKCDPDRIERSRARFEKLGREVPYEPCCPNSADMKLMLEDKTIQFYIPNPANPLEYAYHPELYSDKGIPIVPMGKPACSARAGVHATDATIFESLEGDELPIQFLME